MRGRDPGAALMFRFVPFLMLSACLLSCGSRRPEDQAPVPSLARAPTAQKELRELEEAWTAADVNERGRLLPALERFVRRYPNDPSTDRARVLLAWLYLKQGELSDAEREIETTLAGPPGAARDSATIVEAAILTERKRPGEALARLAPLRGKLVSADAKRHYGRVRVRAALEARRWRVAVGAMADFLDETGQGRDRVEVHLRRALARVPPHASARLLAEMRAKGPSRLTASERWLEEALTEHLKRVALRDRDPQLARQLLEGASTSLRTSEEGQALSELAGAGQREARIEGRTVGFVLTGRDATARRRSAQVAAGIVDSLGLGRAEDESSTRLVVREDRDGLAEALSGLAGEGASVLVTGVDAPSAAVALTFAEAKRVPVIVLTNPPDKPEKMRYGFVLGVSAERERQVLETEITRRSIEETVVLGPGRGGCDAEPTHAGGPRFPVQTWRQEGVGAVIVLGDPACASRVAREVVGQKFRPLLALGLDAAERIENESQTVETVALSAGAFPLRETSDRDTSERGVGWFELLGRDAARLARKALEVIPETTASDRQAVRTHHDLARSALASAQATLETTEARGFGRAQIIERSLGVVSQGPGEASSGPKRP